MKRIMLTIAYDGTAYVGWQVQKNGIAVEQVINEKLSELLEEDITIIGASRTDSGVHARGNVAVFDTETRIPTEKIGYALNQYLPADIRIVRSQEVAPDFHPRHVSCTKTYQYTYFNARYCLPTARLYAGYIYFPLDIEKMKEAAKYLVGTHDFLAFSTARGQQKTSVRTIHSIDITSEWLDFDDTEYAKIPEKEEETSKKCSSAEAAERENRKMFIEFRPQIVKITVKGDGFLYNMVRLIAAALACAGMGVFPPEYVKEILESRDRSRSPAKAAACGLTLVKIDYNEADIMK